MTKKLSIFTVIARKVRAFFYKEFVGRKKWNSHEEFVLLVKDGRSLREKAEILGRSYYSVKSKHKRMLKKQKTN